jgi:cell division protein ZapB
MQIIDNLDSKIEKLLFEYEKIKLENIALIQELEKMKNENDELIKNNQDIILAINSTLALTGRQNHE